MNDKFFTVLKLHRDDLQELVTDKAKRDAISDSEMQELADKLGAAIMGNFWDSLRVLVFETSIITK